MHILYYSLYDKNAKLKHELNVKRITGVFDKAIGGLRLGVSETAFFHRVSPCILFTMILLVIPDHRLSWLYFSLLESAFGIRRYRRIFSSQRFGKHNVLNLQGH